MIIINFDSWEEIPGSGKDNDLNAICFVTKAESRCGNKLFHVLISYYHIWCCQHESQQQYRGSVVVQASLKLYKLSLDKPGRVIFNIQTSSSDQQKFNSPHSLSWSTYLPMTVQHLLSPPSQNNTSAQVSWGQCSNIS